MTLDQIPGMLVAVVSEGEVLYMKTLGVADIENQIPITDSTVFEIGSVSKQFTAVLILQLMEQRQLTLDDKIQKYLPEIPGEWYDITIRQLLGHTSGIPDYESIASYGIYKERLPAHEIINIAHSAPLDFEPGEKYRYSNTGYFLLARIIERVAGQSFSEMLSNRIFKPIGATVMRDSDPNTIIKNRCSGYARTMSRIENRPANEPSTALGVGGLVSDVHDLVKWDLALYGNEVLSEESKKLMWTPGVLNNGERTNYGLGWRLDPYKGNREQYHYGMTAGFVANSTRFPDRKLTFIVLANRHQLSISRILKRVMDTFLID